MTREHVRRQLLRQYGMLGLSLMTVALAVWSSLPRTPRQLEAAGARRTENVTGASETDPHAPAGADVPGMLKPLDPGAGLIAEHDPYPFPAGMEEINLLKQTPAEANAKSVGCITCHQNVKDPHFKETLHIGCTDCHGGNPTATTIQEAHIAPRHANAWTSAANPVRSYTLLNHESPEFIRFVNPGDLRVAHLSCGTTACHPKEVLHNRKSMMTHGCMLWGAALYNNGAVPFKRARYGEAYSMKGTPLRLQTVPPPTREEIQKKGVVPFLDPLPRFEITQPGNILRIFEPGGKFRPDVGIPEKKEDPGRPFLSRLSNRGLGTENRTDPVFIGLQKTRLLDPTLNFLGTNDHAGDYRSSGCTACHVVYANDRSPVHSGPYHVHGNRGTAAASLDPTIPKDRSGHPIEHRFAPSNGIPTSQCIICHMHPGTTVMNTYIGYMWWNLETDAHLMYGKPNARDTAEGFQAALNANPEETAATGRWSDPEFLRNIRDLNDKTDRTQFADFHGHGWPFSAVFKKDRKGNHLDHEGRIVEPSNEKFRQAVALPAEIKNQHRLEHPTMAPGRDGLPVHMLDIHMEKGMHCVDCHFVQDMHGNGRLQMEVRAAVEIGCQDCHGTSTEYASLRTSGPAAYTSSKEGGRDLTLLKSPSGRPRFEREGTKVFQNSLVEKNLRWEVTQVKDTLDPTHPEYNRKSHLAKTVKMTPEGISWGGAGGAAHSTDKVSCIVCHSSWNASCYGCHLPQNANQKSPSLHFEGLVSRNKVNYNWQTLRDDTFMIARDGDVTGNRIGPSRSSCAIHVGSYNQNREAVYVQQQTISHEGFSGIAFSTNVPHTVRGGPSRRKNGVAIAPEAHLPGRSETKSCTDCHLSVDNDNNAIMAQLLMQGTNYLNFMGRFCWIASGEHGLAAAVVTEREEPQAVIGSSLHEIAWPDRYHKHLEHGLELKHFYEHPGKDIADNVSHPGRGTFVRSLQARGEYLYAACGPAGLKVFDIAFIEHKGFSERIVSTPVSPAGQKFFVNMTDATCVAAPATTALDPTRKQVPENREQKIHPMYAFIYVTDRVEGLVIVGAATLLDGNPVNNFLKREVTFNPQGILKGARNLTIFGTHCYISCDAGLAVVSLEDPTKPKLVSLLGKGVVDHPENVQFQFRYGFVCDKDGLLVIDVTDPAKPRAVSRLRIPHPKSIYVARTYAYVACGEHGLYILDVENPENPKVDQVYTADGCIKDLHDVKLGIAYNSQVAYLADGKYGLKVVQLTSSSTPGADGFSPRPTPKLIATLKLPRDGHALSISEALDRDRGVDEAGNQLSVFGRVGARPLNLQEQQRMYLKDGKVWKVSDHPEHPVYQRRDPAPAAARPAPTTR